MDTTCKTMRDIFVANYEARFGFWPARRKPVEQDIWFQIIDTINEYEIDVLFGRLQFNMQNNVRKKPLLPDVEKALRQIRPERKTYTEFGGGDNERTMTLKEYRALNRNQKEDAKPPVQPVDHRTEEDLRIEAIERAAWYEEDEE